jgi:hypothetical protein
MWVFCDKCSGAVCDRGFKDCAQCGDCFCSVCDSHIEEIISFKIHSRELDFCSVECIQEYLSDLFDADDIEVGR